MKTVYPENPIIVRTMATGYAKPVVYPICPVCGSECDTVYRNKAGDIVGCEECVGSKDAWDCEECFH